MNEQDNPAGTEETTLSNFRKKKDHLGWRRLSRYLITALKSKEKRCASVGQKEKMDSGDNSPSSTTTSREDESSRQRKLDAEIKLRLLDDMDTVSECSSLTTSFPLHEDVEEHELEANNSSSHISYQNEHFHVDSTPTNSFDDSIEEDIGYQISEDKSCEDIMFELKNSAENVKENPTPIISSESLCKEKIETQSCEGSNPNENQNVWFDSESPSFNLSNKSEVNDILDKIVMKCSHELLSEEEKVKDQDDFEPENIFTTDDFYDQSFDMDQVKKVQEDVWTGLVSDIKKPVLMPDTVSEVTSLQPVFSKSEEVIDDSNKWYQTQRQSAAVKSSEKEITSNTAFGSLINIIPTLAQSEFELIADEHQENSLVVVSNNLSISGGSFVNVSCNKGSSSNECLDRALKDSSARSSCRRQSLLQHSLNWPLQKCIEKARLVSSIKERLDTVRTLKDKLASKAAFVKAVKEFRAAVENLTTTYKQQDHQGGPSLTGKMFSADDNIVNQKWKADDLDILRTPFPRRSWYSLRVSGNDNEEKLNRREVPIEEKHFQEYLRPDTNVAVETMTKLNRSTTFVFSTDSRHQDPNLETSNQQTCNLAPDRRTRWIEQKLNKVEMKEEGKGSQNSSEKALNTSDPDFILTPEADKTYTKNVTGSDKDIPLAQNNIPEVIEVDKTANDDLTDENPSVDDETLDLVLSIGHNEDFLNFDLSCIGENGHQGERRAYHVVANTKSTNKHLKTKDTRNNVPFTLPMSTRTKHDQPMTSHQTPSQETSIAPDSEGEHKTYKSLGKHNEESPLISNDPCDIKTAIDLDFPGKNRIKDIPELDEKHIETVMDCNDVKTTKHSPTVQPPLFSTPGVNVIQDPVSENESKDLPLPESRHEDSSELKFKSILIPSDFDKTEYSSKKRSGFSMQNEQENQIENVCFDTPGTQPETNEVSSIVTVTSSSPKMLSCKSSQDTGADITHLVVDKPLQDLKHALSVCIKQLKEKVVLFESLEKTMMQSDISQSSDILKQMNFLRSHFPGNVGSCESLSDQNGDCSAARDDINTSTNTPCHCLKESGVQTTNAPPPPPPHGSAETVPDDYLNGLTDLTATADTLTSHVTETFQLVDEMSISFHDSLQTACHERQGLQDSLDQLRARLDKKESSWNEKLCHLEERVKTSPTLQQMSEAMRGLMNDIQQDNAKSVSAVTHFTGATMKELKESVERTVEIWANNFHEQMKLMNSAVENLQESNSNSRPEHSYFHDNSAPVRETLDTLRMSLMEMKHQRDAEKMYHKITRQSLRALERDHDRLRQELLLAPSRRKHDEMRGTSYRQARLHDTLQSTLVTSADDFPMTSTPCQPKDRHKTSFSKRESKFKKLEKDESKSKDEDEHVP